MDRARSKQEVAAWTNAQTVPTVRVRAARTWFGRTGTDFAGQRRRVHHRLPLCARERLYHRLEQGHRRPCDEGRDPGDDFGPGSRSAARTSQGTVGPVPGGGSTGAGQRRSRPRDRPADLAARRSRLAEQATRRHRPLERSVPGRGGVGRQGQRRGAAGRGEPARGTHRLRTDQGALRWRGDGAQRRYRRSGQRGRQHWTRPVPGRRHLTACAFT